MSQIARIEPARVVHELICKPIGTYVVRYSTTNDEIISRIAFHGHMPANPYVVLSVRVDEAIYHCPIMHYYLPMDDSDLFVDDRLPELIERCHISTEQTDWKIDSDRFQKDYTLLYSSSNNSSKSQLKCDDHQKLGIFEKQFHDDNRREFSILKTLSYFHLATFYGLSPEMNRLIFADHGESLQRKFYEIKSSGEPMSQRLAMISHQITCGMMYLEAKGIIHRDLHAGNILIDKYYFIRIAGFEHAIRIDEEQEGIEQKFQIRRLAPELMDNEELGQVQIKQFSSKSDVWAYGLIFMELTIDIHEHLYPNLPILNDDREEMTHIIEYVKTNGQIHGKPDDCPENIYEILKPCWKFNRDERISFTCLRDNTFNLLKST